MINNKKTPGINKPRLILNSQLLSNKQMEFAIEKPNAIYISTKKRLIINNS